MRESSMVPLESLFTEDGGRDDFVTCCELVHDIHTGDDLAKVGVVAIEEERVFFDDKELGIIGDVFGERLAGHAQAAGCKWLGRSFGGKGVAASRAVACGIATLNYPVFYPVKRLAVAVAVGPLGKKIDYGFGGQVGAEFDDEDAFGSGYFYLGFIEEGLRGNGDFG